VTDAAFGIHFDSRLHDFNRFVDLLCSLATPRQCETGMKVLTIEFVRLFEKGNG
jgi:hypothetical protein